MARKNPFANIIKDDPQPVASGIESYTIRGASRSLISSIDEMSSRAESLLQGETIVELEPDEIDDSFVKDRMDDEDTERLLRDDREFVQMVEAIRARGQDSPILVRPHPTSSGRYQIVFGHRRRRAAKLLGRKVRAVIKDIQDRDHVIAQGQENFARKDLSFIERARYAANLVTLRYDDDNATVLAALGTDRASLSKMLAVAGLPNAIITWIGAAKGIGRDRWYELKLLLDNPVLLNKALDVVRSEAEPNADSDERFNRLVIAVKAARSTKREKSGSSRRTWSPADSAIAAEIASSGKRFNLVLKSKGADAKAFGDYLSENLDRFYKAFRQESMEVKNGD